MSRRIINETDSDREVVKELGKRIERVTGCVVEMVETKPSYLLSPLFREILAKEAKELQALGRTVQYMLCLDNLVGDEVFDRVRSLITPVPSVPVPEKPDSQPLIDNPS